jgi:hypothetical protein
VSAIRATWTNGRIVPAEPVDWPEGSELLVEPIVPNGGDIDRPEDEWGDDPESVAAWISAVERIEPPVWAEDEREEYERYCLERRQASIDAVRKQMDAMPDSDAP